MVAVIVVVHVDACCRYTYHMEIQSRSYSKGIMNHGDAAISAVVQGKHTPTTRKVLRVKTELKAKTFSE